MSQSFLEGMFGEYFLDDVVDWIADHCDPDDVFTEDQLVEWASNRDPTSLFSEEALAEWALANGYMIADRGVGFL